MFEGVEEYSFKRFTERKEHQKVVQKGDGPLVNKCSYKICKTFFWRIASVQVEHKCENCGNEEMTYTTQQTRSVDEGQTVFYTCPKCRFAQYLSSTLFCIYVLSCIFSGTKKWRIPEILLTTVDPDNILEN